MSMVGTMAKLAVGAMLAKGVGNVMRGGGIGGGSGGGLGGLLAVSAVTSKTNKVAHWAEILVVV